MRVFLLSILICGITFSGCGTTKWTDTGRTATEQLLISDAMDRAVSRLDFCSVAGKRVHLDSKPINHMTDSAYLVSLLRQHMLASGCIVEESRNDADYVVEVRAGAIGTDRREVMIGMPATQITGMLPINGIPTSIPKMPLANKTEQRAVVKIAVFAYNRKTGRPLWQSGTIPVESTAKNVWVLGAGPFERGTIFEGTKFVGSKIKIPLVSPGEKHDQPGLVAVADEAYFTEPGKERAPEELPAGDSARPKAAKASAVAATKATKKDKPPSQSGDVIPAGHVAPVTPPKAAKPAKNQDSPPAEPLPFRPLGKLAPVPSAE